MSGCSDDTRAATCVAALAAGGVIARAPAAAAAATVLVLLPVPAAGAASCDVAWNPVYNKNADDGRQLKILGGARKNRPQERTNWCQN